MTERLHFHFHNLNVLPLLGLALQRQVYLALLKSVSDPHTLACIGITQLSIQNSNSWAPLLQNQNHGEARETTLGP